MTESNVIKNLPLYLSVSEGVLLSIFIPYTLLQINQIKAEQEEIKKHLATILSVIDPEGKKHIDQISQAIRILDGRLVKTQEELEYLGKESSPKKEVLPVYQRLTKRSTPELPSIPEGNEDLDDDFDADLAAMK